MKETDRENDSEFKAVDSPYPRPVAPAEPSWESVRTENPLATMACQAGWISLIPGIGLLVGPAAMFFGIKALKGAPSGINYALFGVAVGLIGTLFSLLIFGPTLSVPFTRWYGCQYQHFCPVD